MSGSTVQVSAIGSYTSAEANPIPPWSPPATRTRPSASRVAVWSALAVFRGATRVQMPVLESKTSASAIAGAIRNRCPLQQGPDHHRAGLLCDCCGLLSWAPLCSRPCQRFQPWQLGLPVTSCATHDKYTAIRERGRRVQTCALPSSPGHWPRFPAWLLISTELRPPKEFLPPATSTVPSRRRDAVCCWIGRYSDYRKASTYQ